MIDPIPLHWEGPRRIAALEATLGRVAAAHAPNAVTKCCMQCGRPSPCLTLQILESS